MNLTSIGPLFALFYLAAALEAKPYYNGWMANQNNLYNNYRSRARPYGISSEFSRYFGPREVISGVPHYDHSRVPNYRHVLSPTKLGGPNYNPANYWLMAGLNGNPNIAAGVNMAHSWQPMSTRGMERFNTRYHLGYGSFFDFNPVEDLTQMSNLLTNPFITSSTYNGIDLGGGMGQLLANNRQRQKSKKF